MNAAGRWMVGFRIRVRLKEMGISGRELARKIGHEPGSVSRWVRGATLPPTHMVDVVAGALGVSPAWLTGWQCPSPVCPAHVQKVA